MRSVLKLKGYQALRAFNAFNSLMLGLKMLPAYMAESYEEFYPRVSKLPEADQEQMIRHAVSFVQLAQDEVEALASFCTDKNGIAYSSVNLKNLPLEEIFEIIVAVCVQISKIRVSIVSEEEKKNLKDSVLISEVST